jgi:mitochondrial fission protein ELM1
MYEQTYKRLEKLKNTFDALVITNQKQQLKIEELNNYVSTVGAREEARERVLAGLEEKVKQYEDRESLSSPT